MVGRAVVLGLDGSAVDGRDGELRDLPSEDACDILLLYPHSCMRADRAL